MFWAVDKDRHSSPHALFQLGRENIAECDHISSFILGSLASSCVDIPLNPPRSFAQVTAFPVNGKSVLMAASCLGHILSPETGLERVRET